MIDDGEGYRERAAGGPGAASTREWRTFERVGAQCRGPRIVNATVIAEQRIRRVVLRLGPALGAAQHHHHAADRYRGCVGANV